MAQARRRGLEYEIVTQDKFSAALDAFIVKVNTAKRAWVSFRREAKGSATDSAVGSTRQISREMESVVGATRRANVEIVRMTRNLRRSAVAATSVASSMKAITAATTKAETRQKAYANEVKRASLFQSNLNTRLGRAAVILARIVGIFALFRSAQAVFGVFSAAIREAVGFSSRIEDARLSIQALIASVFDVVDATGEVQTGIDKFRSAFGLAEEQVKKLRIEGLRTAATFDQLLDTFQVAIAPGAQAGLPLDQIRQLAVSISQAAQAIGLPQNQLAEEIRSLLQGTISKRTTRIATALGIENEDIQNAKELGTLFEFLSEKFEQFGTASSTALQNFSTRLANLKDAVGQTLSEGLAGSFLELKGLILDITEALIDVKNIRIARPFLELLNIVDRLGEELIKGLRGFVENLDIERVAILFQGMADAVRVLVATFVTIGKVLLPVAETFSLIFSSVTAIARTINEWTGALSKLTAVLKVIFGLWAIIRTLQLASFVLGLKQIRQLATRVGLVKLLSAQWQRVAAAATAATAAAGVGQGVALAGGASALKGVLAGVAAALPFLLTAIGVIGAAILVLSSDARKAFASFVFGIKASEDEAEQMSAELSAAFLIVNDAVRQAEEAMEVLSKRFDDLDKKAKESEFLVGFSGVARSAAQVIGGIQIEFEDAIDSLNVGGRSARKRIGDLRDELTKIGVSTPTDQLARAVRLIGDFADYRDEVQRLTAEIEEARKTLTGFSDIREENIIALNTDKIRQLDRQYGNIEKTLEEMGIDWRNIDLQASRVAEITRELVPLTRLLGDTLSTDTELRSKIVEEAQAKLRTLNAQLADDAIKRRRALREETNLQQGLLAIALEQSGLDTPAEELDAQINKLRLEFDLREAALKLQINQAKDLLAANEDVTELEETITKLQQEQVDLTTELGNAVLAVLVPSLEKANVEMAKLQETTSDAVAAALSDLSLVGLDDTQADISRAIIEQERLFSEVESRLRGVRRAVSQTIPLFEKLGLDQTVLGALELIDAKLSDLPEQLGQAKAEAVGRIVNTALSRARSDVIGLLEDTEDRLEEVQATLGKEGIARDLTIVQTRVAQQFSRLRDDLISLENRVRNLATEAALGGAVITAGIFTALGDVIEQQIKQLNEGELKALKAEVETFALDLSNSLSIENRNLSERLTIQRKINQIERDGFAAREEAGITSLKQQQARIQLERDFALEENEQIAAALIAAAAALASLGQEVNIKRVLLELDNQRLAIQLEAAEALRTIEDLLERQRLRKEDPVAFFLEELPDKAEVTADRTIEALNAIKDFLIDDLSGALTDALFRNEDTLLERAERLAEQLVQTFIKEFLQNQIFNSGFFAQLLGRGAPTQGGGGSGTFSGGQVNRARATLAHYTSAAKGFTTGGPVGFGTNPVVAPSAPVRPPAGIDPRDNVPAWLSPKEYVMPVNAVAEYGLAVMDALRSRKIPRAVMQALLGSTRSSSRARTYGGSSLGFRQGGSVPSVQGGRGGVSIINATNQKDIYDAISTSDGQDVILNVVRFGRDRGLI